MTRRNWVERFKTRLEEKEAAIEVVLDGGEVRIEVGP
jgi:hypothetical protein